MFPSLSVTTFSSPPQDSLPPSGRTRARCHHESPFCFCRTIVDMPYKWHHTRCVSVCGFSRLASRSFPAFARIAVLLNVSFWSPLHGDSPCGWPGLHSCGLPKHCPPRCGRATESRREELGYRTGHGGRHGYRHSPRWGWRWQRLCAPLWQTLGSLLAVTPAFCLLQVCARDSVAMLR